MSGQCTGWVLRHGPKDRAMRAVLVTIADAANRDGEHAHPGTAAIVEGSLYSLCHVKRVLRRLVDEGWVDVEEQGGGRGIATTYRVRMDRRQTGSSEGASSEAKPAHVEEPDHRPETGSLGDRSEGETGSSESETGSFGDSCPLTATVLSNGSTSASDDAEGSVARQIVRDHWQRCTDEGRPTPTLRAVRGSPFMALVQIVGSLLKAGHRPEAVRSALWTTSTYTVNAMTLELNRRNQRPNGRPSNLSILKALAEREAG